MTTMNIEGGSATIYQFPARGRYAARAVGEPMSSRSVEPANAPRVAAASCWYHDAAIEAERASAN